MVARLVSHAKFRGGNPTVCSRLKVNHSRRGQQVGAIVPRLSKNLEEISEHTPSPLIGFQPANRNRQTNAGPSPDETTSIAVWRNVAFRVESMKRLPPESALPSDSEQTGRNPTIEAA